MCPEDAAQRGKSRSGKAFEHARMVPEFELDDIRFSCQSRHVIQIAGNDDMGSAGLDQIRVAAVARFLKNKKDLFRILRQYGAYRCVSLADATPQMRSDVQDFHCHSAATAGTL